MAGRLDGKVALRAKLVVAAMNADGGQQTVHIITKQGGEAIFVRTDALKPWKLTADSIVPTIVQEF